MSMFAEAYETYARHLVAETPVLVQGTVMRREGTARGTA